MSNKTITRETTKQTVKKFFAEHDQKELNVTIYLNLDRRKSICNFHIDAQEREITEDSSKTELIISNYAAPSLSLVPDDVTIRYDEIVKCENNVATGETEDDIVADLLEITYINGTVIELGFLYV